MLKSLKKLFGRRDEGTVQTMPEPRTASRSPFAASAADHQAKPSNGDMHARPAMPAPTGSRLALPLRSVLAKLPPELSGRVRQMDVGEAEVFIPMQKVLSQLATGAVRISYGELRQASPPGTFSPENDKDRVVVDLPLQDILTRVNPGLLARRPAQKIIEIPAEVTGPFSGQTRVVISNSQPVKGMEAHTPKSASAPEDTTFKRSGGAAPAPARVVPGPAKVVPAAPAAPVQAAPVAPVAPLAPAAPIPMSPTALPAMASARPAAPVTAAQPQAQPATADIFKRNGVPTAQPVPQAPRPAAPVAPVIQMAPAPVNPPVAPARPAMPTAAPKPQPTAEDVFRRNGGMPTQPAPQVVRPAAPPVAPVVPMASPIVEEEQPLIPASPALKNFTGFKPTPPQAAPTPVAPVTPVEELQPIRFNPVGQPAPVFEEVVAPAPIAFAPAVEEAPVAPAPVVPPAPEEPAETRFLNIKLSDISANWPEPIQQEAARVSAPNALVGLPFGKVEAAMKAGKLAFPWSVVRAWIRPNVPPMVSPHDATFLELPLKIIAPLFLAEMRGAKAAPKKVSMAEDIPDLFSGGSVATPPPAAPATVPAVVDVRQQEIKSQETNYYAKQAESAAAENPNIDPALLVKKGAKLGTSFLQRYATPNDIVAKASSLPGVGGSLIALPDGLLVAAKVSPDMNADTLAGFLPAIFSKVSQTTKELRMGELNNLNFTVGNVPWKIFRVGAIYFAAFGIAGQPMPTAQLAGLAAELDRKPKQ